MLAMAPNGDLYTGGHITPEVSNASFAMVVRWNGSLWSRVGGFAHSGTRCHCAGNTDEVYALAVAPTGELYVGGIFSAADGFQVHNIAPCDGTTWHAVGTDGAINLGCQVHTPTLAANGDFYVGGKFENSSPVALVGDGRAWHALSPGLNGPVLSLVWVPANLLLVGGSLTEFGNSGAVASYFAVLDPATCQATGYPLGVPRPVPTRRKVGRKAR